MAHLTHHPSLEMEAQSPRKNNPSRKALASAAAGPGTSATTAAKPKVDLASPGLIGTSRPLSASTLALLNEISTDDSSSDSEGPYAFARQRSATTVGTVAAPTAASTSTSSASGRMAQSTGPEQPTSELLRKRKENPAAKGSQLLPEPEPSERSQTSTSSGSSVTQTKKRVKKSTTSGMASLIGSTSLVNLPDAATSDSRTNPTDSTCSADESESHMSIMSQSSQSSATDSNTGTPQGLHHLLSITALPHKKSHHKKFFSLLFEEDNMLRSQQQARKAGVSTPSQATPTLSPTSAATSVSSTPSKASGSNEAKTLLQNVLQSPLSQETPDSELPTLVLTPEAPDNDEKDSKKSKKSSTPGRPRANAEKTQAQATPKRQRNKASDTPSSHRPAEEEEESSNSSKSGAPTSGNFRSSTTQAVASEASRAATAATMVGTTLSSSAPSLASNEPIPKPTRGKKGPKADEVKSTESGESASDWFAKMVRIAQSGQLVSSVVSTEEEGKKKEAGENSALDYSEQEEVEEEQPNKPDAYGPSNQMKIAPILVDGRPVAIRHALAELVNPEDAFAKIREYFDKLSSAEEGQRQKSAVVIVCRDNKAANVLIGNIIEKTTIQAKAHSKHVNLGREVTFKHAAIATGKMDEEELQHIVKQVKAGKVRYILTDDDGLSKITDIKKYVALLIHHDVPGKEQIDPLIPEASSIVSIFRARCNILGKEVMWKTPQGTTHPRCISLLLLRPTRRCRECAKELAPFMAAVGAPLVSEALQEFASTRPSPHDD